MKTIYQFLAICISIVTYAQPAGSCTTGATKLNAEGKLYGCVEGKWIKLSEDVVANFNQGGTNGRTTRNGDYIYVQENGGTYQLPNLGQAPISIAGKVHQIGKMIYTNGHFYQGVADGLWHQVDNIEKPKNIINVGTGPFVCDLGKAGQVYLTNIGYIQCSNWCMRHENREDNFIWWRMDPYWGPQKGTRFLGNDPVIIPNGNKGSFKEGFYLAKEGESGVQWMQEINLGFSGDSSCWAVDIKADEILNEVMERCVIFKK